MHVLERRAGAVGDLAGDVEGGNGVGAGLAAQTAMAAAPATTSATHRSKCMRLPIILNPPVLDPIDPARVGPCLREILKRKALR